MPLPSQHDCILRRKQVEQVTGLKRSTLYLRIAQGQFPRPISLGGRAVGWLSSEVHAWLGDRVQCSRSTRGSFEEGR